MRDSSDGGRHRGRSVRKNQLAIGGLFLELTRIWLMLVVFAPPSPLGVARYRALRTESHGPTEYLTRILVLTSHASSMPGQ